MAPGSNRAWLNDGTLSLLLGKLAPKIPIDIHHATSLFYLFGNIYQYASCTATLFVFWHACWYTPNGANFKPQNQINCTASNISSYRFNLRHFLLLAFLYVDTHTNTHKYIYRSLHLFIVIIITVTIIIIILLLSLWLLMQMFIDQMNEPMIAYMTSLSRLNRFHHRHKS